MTTATADIDRDAAVAESQRAIAALAKARDYAGLQTYVLSSTEPPEVIMMSVWSLLNEGDVRAPYLMSKLLHLKGVVNPIVSFALYFGGHLCGFPEDAAEGLKILRRQFDQQTPEAQANTYASLEPLILQQIGLAFAEGDFTLPILRLLDCLKQIVPEFRQRFDLDAPAVPVDLAALQAKGRAQVRLLPTPAQPPRAERKALVAYRDKVFPHFHNSRLFEQGPTMVTALVNYGWDARFMGLHFFKKESDDARRIVSACLDEKPDVLILDAVLLNFPEPLQLLIDLKRLRPDMKIIGMYFDAWSIKPKQFRQHVQVFDLLWTVSPDFQPWQMPELEGKVFQMPLPRGADFGGPFLPLKNTIYFSGGVAAYNWHRAFWISAMDDRKLPLDKTLDGFAADDLPALESYLTYMRRLADARCAVNFSMRQNMTTFSVTARSFEILAAGALLVQERAPEMDCYFIEGEHYLPFSSFAELRGIFDFIRDEPRKAEKVRRAGHAFYRQRYHDDIIIGAMAGALYRA